MNIFKLQILTSNGDEDGPEEFTDVYFDVEQIDGFFIPIKREKDTEVGEAINIFFNGDMMTIKQEEHIIDYLRTEFVDKVI